MAIKNQPPQDPAWHSNRSAQRDIMDGYDVVAVVVHFTGVMRYKIECHAPRAIAGHSKEYREMYKARIPYMYVVKLKNNPGG